MASSNRGIEVGHVYHVLNRGVLRQKLFDSASAYFAFEELVRETLERTPLSIFTYQLMPTHWHFVVRPDESNEQVSEFFHYLSGTHAKRFRAWHENVGIGHVYQAPFKSFPVQSDGHCLTLLRYVERNARRARLVERAEQWRWGGLWCRLNGKDDFLESNWPVERPDDWLDWVNRPLTQPELSAIRTSIRRGSPLGDPEWTQMAAAELNLLQTLRRPGRPSKLVP